MFLCILIDWPKVKCLKSNYRRDIYVKKARVLYCVFLIKCDELTCVYLHEIARGTFHVFKGLEFIFLTYVNLIKLN